MSKRLYLGEFQAVAKTGWQTIVRMVTIGHMPVDRKVVAESTVD
jgi:hypothetical protein